MLFPRPPPKCQLPTNNLHTVTGGEINVPPCPELRRNTFRLIGEKSKGTFTLL